MASPKIAIIGAGPAGCMLARLLHLGGISATIFEGESSPNYRAQGGTLDLHTKTGIAAMKEAGLFDKFLEHARYDGQYMAIVDKNLNYQVRRGLDSKSEIIMGQRPEIDRARLRQVLTESLPDGMIQWGHHLKEVRDGTLVFEHTTVTGFDLIVGADGAWSKVRKALAPEVQPIYTGVAIQELSIPDAKNTAPEIYKLVNRGSLFACADGRRLVLQQLGDDSINVYVTYVREDADWASKCGYDATDLEETRAAMKKEYAEWCPELRHVFDRVQGRCVPRTLHRLPIGATWQHKTGLTMIGDAAHLMTPFAGEGVNQALEDALILSRSILDATKASQDLDKAVAKFETSMIARVKEVQQLAHDMGEMWLFTPGSPQAVMPKMVSRRIGSHLPWVARPLATAVVHSIFFVKGIKN